MSNSKYEYYVYCPALESMWQYGSKRAADLGASRKANACDEGWTYIVLRETPDTWEVWDAAEGVGSPGTQVVWLTARMLKIFVHGESFCPWDAEVVS